MAAQIAGTDMKGLKKLMSDDLISRKALIADMRSRKYINKALCEIFETIVDDAPMAFDKEKVIEELVELRQKEYSDSDEEIEIIDGEEIYDEGRSQGRFEAYHRAIKIVEKGGIEEKLMKVWITKYALTKGIIETEGEVSDDFPDILDAKGIVNYLHGEGKEWHMTKESAVQKAEEMRQKKIASLKKQIDKLERMRFE